MDVLIYICSLIVIGALFFINNFSKGNNAILIIFILSLFGLVMLTITPAEVVTGTNMTVTKSETGQIIGATSEFITEPFEVASFPGNLLFAASYLAFLILSIAVFYLNDKGPNEGVNLRE